MAKDAVKKVSSAAVAGAVRSALPWIDEGFRLLREDIRALRTEIHDEIRNLDAKVDNLRDEMLDRFERQLALINETNDPVTRLEGKLAGYMEAVRLFTAPVNPIKTTRKRAG